MQAYISVGLSKRKFLDQEITTIVDTLAKFEIKSLVFVDRYQFSLEAEQQMMQQAFADIEQSDLLIAETSSKGIGIGVEAGYAKAKGKAVFYLRQVNASHSTTVSGISDFKIMYADTLDLSRQLTAALIQWRIKTF